MYAYGVRSKSSGDMVSNDFRLRAGHAFIHSCACVPVCMCVCVCVCVCVHVCEIGVYLSV